MRTTEPECHELKFYLNPNESDVTFIVEDQKIPVKKWLLRMKSEVFDKMFSNEFKDEEEIEISQTKADVFKAMISFLYCEHKWRLNDETTPSFAMNVFECADQYALNHLTACVERKLISMITTDNMPDIYVFAKIYNLQNLVKKLNDFIDDNIEYYMNKSMDELKRISTSTDNYLMELIINKKNNEINKLEQQLSGIKKDLPHK